MLPLLLTHVQQHGLHRKEVRRCHRGLLENYQERDQQQQQVPPVGFQRLQGMQEKCASWKTTSETREQQKSTLTNQMKSHRMTIVRVQPIANQFMLGHLTVPQSVRIFNQCIYNTNYKIISKSKQLKFRNVSP